MHQSFKKLIRCGAVASWWELWQDNFVMHQRKKKFKSEVRGSCEVVRVLRCGKVVSFDVTFEGVRWWWESDSSRYMVPESYSSRGDSTTSKVGFILGTVVKVRSGPGGTQPPCFDFGHTCWNLSLACSLLSECCCNNTMTFISLLVSL